MAIQWHLIIIVCRDQQLSLWKMVHHQLAIKRESYEDISLNDHAISFKKGE